MSPAMARAGTLFGNTFDMVLGYLKDAACVEIRMLLVENGDNR